MDDIHRPQRRDYALPGQRPAAPQSQPHHQVHHQPHQPVHHTPEPVVQPPPQPQAQPEPHYQPQPEPQPQPVSQYQQPGYIPPSQYHQVHHQTAQHHAQPRRSKAPAKLRRGLSVVMAVALAGAAIYGGSKLVGGNTEADTIPDSIAKQVNFSLYFPSPMPHGFTYMKGTATFQIGQVFYKFANGSSRVTVEEQPMPNPKPNLSYYKSYSQFQSPIGKATVGLTFGEPTAYVLAGNTTLITLNSVGKVTQDDLRTAVMSLKYIGHSADKNS